MEALKDKAKGMMEAFSRSGDVEGVTGSVQHALRPPMTNNFGIPTGDISHSLNVGGNVLACDVMLMEKQQMFNRSKIVERMVHPCGSGAFGYFELTQDMSAYTKAKLFNGVGKRTPIFTRFSTVTFGKEFPDSGRNPRGFATKFYTEEGNYDIVGLNFPVFFVRDPALGPDNIHALQRNPKNFLLDYDSWFDWMSMTPESMHCNTMFWSDRGTPVGWRFMPGFGCHTFKWVNAAGEHVYVKYHFISEQGVKNFTWPEAIQMCGRDPDFAKRDLWELIEGGGEATWQFAIQLMTEEQAMTYKWDPFDVTKVWSHADFPLMKIGRLVLNRNPENYHRDVEQAAFSPGSLVPGIEPSPDPLLQFRMFFYRDTQLYRLGANLHQIPVNCPYMAGKLNSMNRDGAMRCDDNGGTEPHYMPNSIGKIKPDDRYNWKPMPVSGVAQRASASRHESDPDADFAQARTLFLEVMTQEERQHLFMNIADPLKLVKPAIAKRFLAQCYKVHPDYANGILALIGDKHKITLDEVESVVKTGPHIDRAHGYLLTA
eukprot:GILJ01004260.1.p1 GENE.GILJ01004260.1~~GILJ01004260.1.p1  ORF type:complete len:542 (+),score=66.30 GILJ01004260.1:149-1774(+)